MIRVLIVDDSALMRSLLTELLSSDPEIEVVGSARDPYVARDKIKELEPDVLTLDVEMPRMDGLTFLRNLMRLRPMPVVMVSTRTAVGAEAALEALEIGAFDVVAKPESVAADDLELQRDELVAKVKAAARAGGRRRPPATGPVARVRPVAPGPKRLGGSLPPPTRGFIAGARIITIGASTGGTEALREVITRLPADAPPVLVAQHMPPGFTTSFAKRLDDLSEVTVVEAEDGQHVRGGTVYIAPGQRHLRLVRTATGLACRLDDGPPVNRHRPSVDVLFASVAEVAGRSAVGALLTGMGEDGARGLHLLRCAGAPIFVQDEATSVVWGMPGAAVKLGPVDAVLPIEAICERLLTSARRAA
jgi:two-component system chemotaxis response regulator CheB